MRQPEPLTLRGFSATGAVIVAACLVLPVLAAAAWHTGLETRGDRRFAAFACVLAALPALGLASFKVRLDVDPVAGLIRVTRRRWFGAERRWEIPARELTAWHFVKYTRQLALCRLGWKPLRLTLFGDDLQARIDSWGRMTLPAVRDPSSAARETRRGKLILGLCVGLGIPLGVLLVFASLAFTQS